MVVEPWFFCEWLLLFAHVYLQIMDPATDACVNQLKQIFTVKKDVVIPS